MRRSPRFLLQLRVELRHVFVQLGELSLARFRVQQLIAFLLHACDQLQQLLTVQSQRQRVDVLGDFIRFQRGEFLQLFQTDGENVFVDGLADIGHQV